MRRPEADVPGRAALYVHPGEVAVSRVPCTLGIVLGSCVSVCLWDERLGIGGANHFLLPWAPAGAADRGRFGATATDLLVERLVSEGTSPRQLRGKIFGGSCSLALPGRAADLGAKNARTAREALQRHGIPLVAEDVGGARGRKVLFHTDDGAAWVRVL